MHAVFSCICEVYFTSSLQLHVWSWWCSVNCSCHNEWTCLWWWGLLMWETGRRLGTTATTCVLRMRIGNALESEQTVPRRRKTLITICDHKPRGRQGETTSAISQVWRDRGKEFVMVLGQGCLQWPTVSRHKLGRHVKMGHGIKYSYSQSPVLHQWWSPMTDCRSPTEHWVRACVAQSGARSPRMREVVTASDHCVMIAVYCLHHHSAFLHKRQINCTVTHICSEQSVQ